jgi:CBS domain-containing protein
MWEHDFACIPVVDADGKAIGMITDRDICMACYTLGQPLANMTVASAASHKIVTVRESETLDAGLRHARLARPLAATTAYSPIVRA